MSAVYTAECVRDSKTQFIELDERNSPTSRSTTNSERQSLTDSCAK